MYSTLQMTLGTTNSNICVHVLSPRVFLDVMTCNSKPLKQNGKVEAPVEAASSPPRTTLLGTIFSPVFNFFSPATKTGKTKVLWHSPVLFYSESWNNLKWRLLRSAIPFSATPGSDSPGQAMEAEEIMKQLDIEQAEEMPSSTLTSTEGITPCHTTPLLPQRLQMTSDPAIEEGEIVNETDMPPLTGTALVPVPLTHLMWLLYLPVCRWLSFSFIVITHLCNVFEMMLHNCLCCNVKPHWLAAAVHATGFTFPHKVLTFSLLGGLCCRQRMSSHLTSGGADQGAVGRPVWSVRGMSLLSSSSWLYAGWQLPTHITCSPRWSHVRWGLGGFWSVSGLNV